MSVTFAKTQGVSLGLALQSIASNTVVLGTAVDVSMKLAALVGIHFGRRIATALTVGAKFRIEASLKATLDGYWFPLVEFQSVVTACEAEAATGTNNAGQKVVTVASTTNIAAGALVFFDNTTIGNSEWGRVKSIIGNTSITLEDDLLNAQSAGASTIYTLAEFFLAKLDLSAVGRLRVVADCSGTGQAVAIDAFMVTADSIG